MNVLRRHFAANSAGRDWVVGFALASAAVGVASGAARLTLLNRISAATLWFLALALAVLSVIVLLPRVVAPFRRPALETLQLFRMTGLGLTFTLLVSVLAVAALNNGNNLLFVVVAMMLSSYLVSGTLARMVLSGIEVECRFPERIHAGTSVLFRCRIRNECRRLPAFGVTMRLIFQRADGSEEALEEYIPFLAAGTERSLALRHPFARRGIYLLRSIQLRSSFPFGFFQRGVVLHPGQRVTVFPKVRPVREFWEKVPFLRGESPGLRRGQGEGLYQIREYQRGDPRRDIHWRSSAKAGRLMVREFLQTEEAPLCLFVDTARPHPRFEDALVVAASLAVHFHGQGAGVRVVCHDCRSGSPPDRDRQLLAALETLAGAGEGSAQEASWGWIEGDLRQATDPAMRILVTGAARASVPAAVTERARVVHLDAL